MDGIYEKNSDGTAKKYYGAAGQTVAVRAVPAGGGAGTLYYLLQDHLGSTVEVLDSSFITYAEMKYYPFGASRSATGTPPTDKLYTGQQEEPGDSALGLYNYKARFYSTTLGRFVSADIVANDGINRFTYAANNPLRFHDPSGHCVQEQDGNWMECSRATMVQFFSCAWGGQCDAGDQTAAVRLYAAAVIQSSHFRWFVGAESQERGNIQISLDLTVEVKGLGRKIPNYPGDDAVGKFELRVGIDATLRKILFTQAGFRAADGIGGYLDGWQQKANGGFAKSGIASFWVNAGPTDPTKNPFAASDWHARVAWDIWFEKDGSLNQEILFSQRGDAGVLSAGITLVGGGLTGGISLVNQLPIVDKLLVASNMTLTVSETGFCRVDTC